MPAKKKNFTPADGAIDKLFTAPKKDTQQTHNAHVVQDTNIVHDTNVTKDTYVTQHANKSSGKRGKRAERFGLLLDENLKEDLTLLSKATNSKSINDMIVTALLEYVEREDNQTKLEQYRKLLQGRL